jgi:C-terminal processing protease CtpA/Prc
MERVAAAMRLASGTTQWTRTRALQEITTCEKGKAVTLVVDSATGPRPVPFQCVAAQPPAEKRPAAVAELASEIWYVDLTRARMISITPVLEKLVRARGVVFDVRGYPTDAGAQILPHLIEAAETDRWMHVAKVVGPFGQNAGWQSAGWNLTPQTPRLTGHVVFLTDERAISYAESVMGYVADRQLGTIVGGTTAGTNGNVATFPVPGGFTVAFTGMRVTRHDGQTPFHLIGVRPDIPVVPTLGGLRDGRDEVLERALTVIRGK